MAWGRIGDVVLATGHLKQLRRWFHPRPVWFLGRSRVKPVVEPFVDAFLPFPDPSEAETDSGTAPAASLERIVNQSFRYIIADIHTFYGGLFTLDSLLAALRADRKFVYEGYYLGKDLAPERPYPAGYEIVPTYEGRADPSTGDDGFHVLNHNTHYIRHVLEQCGVETVDGELWRPDMGHIGPGTEECRRFGIEPGGYVAWQPASENRRKDYPPPHWAETISAFPDQQFVALVEPGKAAGLEWTASHDVRVIETTLSRAMRLIRAARLFVGLDSVLSHIAATLGTPTVCVCPDSHLGYFFPYPRNYGYTNLHTVFHPDYRSCRGCFMTCRHEPLTSTITRGALCLRALPPRLVIDAIRAAL
ncbi:MAG: hypothetical protein OXG98_04860 [Gemmatimonadetes bacterium]|nr:hypothetical protein [Gemmatimonadota bacterium]